MMQGTMGYVMQIGFGLLSGATIAAGLLGFNLPLVASVRSALVATLVFGIAMCGPAMKFEVYGFANPINLLGLALGVVALAAGLAGIFHLPLPGVVDERAALVAVAVIMAVKVLLAVLRRLLY